MNMQPNQNPEQQARDLIDKQLIEAGWVIQNLKNYNPAAGLGIAVREYPTESGPVDYLLFVDRTPVAVIEAKEESFGHKLNIVEEQSSRYATSKLKYISKADIAFLYESTGVITHFTNRNDPTPRAREVFSFHRPETLQRWANEGKQTLRNKLKNIPHLNPNNLPAQALGLRDCQLIAIENMQQSLAQDRPRALIQMATGAGKTYTAISIMYRLLKYTGKRRILFLVDTVNLGEQAEQEMRNFSPSDDNRKFTELHPSQIIKSSDVPHGIEVHICTIQRMYSLLKGEEQEIPENEIELEAWEKQLQAPLPVTYQTKLPPEYFDFIFIDECHRSIYNLWRQVLDYFDAYLIGLTATPDDRTFSFFNQNIVSEYTHEQAVADGVNVGNEVFIIDTKISQKGGTFKAEELIEHRERTTRRKRWQQQDQDEVYSAKQLDRDIVNPSQIRTIIRTFKAQLPRIFPLRNEVPKTLIFAKNDSHADDIIRIVREEFGQGNEFCKKITYRAAEDTLDEHGAIQEKGEPPKTVLANFRNSYYPRIAVTVDMIATGTDIRPLECLIFMRDVKSRNYFEQMKGRGTRTLDKDSLQAVSPSAKTAKTHYVIVDAIGVTKSLKTASTQLDTKRAVSFKDLGRAVVFGAYDTDSISSLAARLARLNKQLSEEEQAQIAQITQGTPLIDIVRSLFDAINADKVHELACELENIDINSEPSEESLDLAQRQRVSQATKSISMELITALEEIRKQNEQKIDATIDELVHAGWAEEQIDEMESAVKNFSEYLHANKDKITALQIFYNQPYRRQILTLNMVKALLNEIKRAKPNLAFSHIWQAYATLDKVNHKPEQELVALVSLIRRVVGIDDKITPFEKTVRKNFQRWIFEHNARAEKPFTEMQMQWLQMIRDHIMQSFSIQADDFELTPFNQYGGLGRAYDVLCANGEDFEALLEEINLALIA
ncbi:type III restriction protein res subunit [Canicola haemoglobinophilus]|uniref:Type III restriction protein res subunit n=1 Tax=Canicola haemoglobinophilus TaxID=733 RepID=A0AB38H6D4_9PAST|nr:DEAD/DEAH box helicase family protein [Canicola haemoglobinophilus]STO55564.1 type III restriction protein res subunit [Canicola haemoglobinophilus]STO67890.1 type III restriction protein res subunit [Canicola haemoglobinophilus]